MLDVGEAEDGAAEMLQCYSSGEIVVLFNPQQGSVGFDLSGGRGTLTLIDAEAVLAFCDLDTAKELFGCEFPEFEDESNPEETDPA